MQNFDVIVAGGGHVGMSMAGMLANYGLKVALIDKRKFEFKKRKGEPSRLLAIALASCNIFKKHNIIKDLSRDGQTISRIRVVDNDSRLYVDFNPNDLDVERFGYMVEEFTLLEQLYKSLKNNKNIIFLDQTTFKGIKQDGTGVTIDIEGNKKISAKLLVAADGKNSGIRKLLGIETMNSRYGQIGIVCDVKHELDHQGVATERFMPSGPFAILPKTGGFTSSIVWTAGDEFSSLIKTLSDAEITELIQERFGEYLGKVELASEVKAFPLELVHAHKYFEGRVVLVGDAAHAIHPLAGQGFNLGLRDADCLAQLIHQNHSLGLDIGSQLMLEDYEKARSFDNNMMIESTHNLNLLFANNLLPVKIARRLGMGAVNRMPWLKKFFMKYAMGLLGEFKLCANE